VAAHDSAILISIFILLLSTAVTPRRTSANSKHVRLIKTQDCPQSQCSHPKSSTMMLIGNYEKDTLTVSMHILPITEPDPL